jgi:hypothetical protein
MRNIAKRWWLSLSFAMAGLAGCAEEKALPDKAVAQENKPAENSIVGAKPAKEDPAARAIVQKAIEAHTLGKPARLDAIKAQHFNMTGRGMMPVVGAREVDGSRETWAIWPERSAFRFIYKLDPDRDAVITGILNPGGGSMRTPEGNTFPIAGADLRGALWDMFAFDWLVTPKALTHPEAIYHQPGRESENGKSYQTVKAYLPNQPEWTLRFSEETHLLERVDYIGFESRVVRKALSFSDHKENSGLRVPTRVKVFGEKILYWDLNALPTYEVFESADKIDPKKFETP